MKRAMTVFALSCSLFACSCGGGGGGSAAPVASITKPQTLLMTGDSTQVGFVPGQTGYTAPGDEAAAVLGIQVTTDAYGGTSAEQMLAGTDGGLPWAERLRKFAPTVVSVKHGFNGGATAAQHAATLREVVRIAHSMGIAVILETPNPVVPLPSIPAQDLVNLAARVQAIRDVAAETGVVLCDHDAAMRAAHLDTIVQMLDGIHPSAAMYRYMGDRVAECYRQVRL